MKDKAIRDAAVVLQHSESIRSYMNRRIPGYGKVDYPVEGSFSIPKSKAMIILALADHQHASRGSQIDPLIVDCGRWLLEDGENEDDQLPGWGLPFEWDAYGDGTTNPPRTVYTISTALAIDALLCWDLVDPGAPSEQIQSLISETLYRYTQREAFSPSGLFAYSLSPFDREYDTFNPAAYLAGQMQRFAFMNESNPRAQLFKDTAHQVMAVLIENVRTSPSSGSPYWNYSVQEEVPNDLAHASYIINGINTFRTYGGELQTGSNLFDPTSHLGDFLKRGLPQAWPIFRSDTNAPARSYDTGIALACSSRWGACGKIRSKFVNGLVRYIGSDGTVSKFPRSRKSPESVVIDEYVSAAYWGYMACLSRLRRDLQGNQLGPSYSLHPGIKGGTQSSSQTSCEFPCELSFAGINFRPMPFIAYGSSDLTAYVDWPELNRVLLLGLTPSPACFESSIPVAIRWTGSAWVVVCRTVPTGHLSVSLLDVFGLESRRFLLSPQGTNSLLFRSLDVGDSLIFVCYYDDSKSKNILLSLSIAGNEIAECWRREISSVLYPPGSTYEMTPNLYLIAYTKAVFVICGGLIAAIDSHTGQTLWSRGFRDFTAIGSKAFPNGKIHVWTRSNCVFPCKPKSFSVSASKRGQYRVLFHALNHRLTSRVLGRDAVTAAAEDYQSNPFEVIQLASVNSPTAGWNEFGLDNSLGRIAWSQIYFLEALVDLLYISKRFGDLDLLNKSTAEIIRSRLDLEVAMLEKVVTRKGFESVSYSVGRHPLQFAVQIGRLLYFLAKFESVTGAMHDYPALMSFAENNVDVSSLCEEQLRRTAPPGDVLLDRCVFPGCEPQGLFWPRGTPVTFDGLNVPFNHQNSWASGLLAYERAIGFPEKIVQDNLRFAIEMISHFVHQNLNGGRFPQNGEWPYWGDLGHRGWSNSLDVSLNTPQSSGDRGVAWISFRTIDVIAVLQSVLSVGARQASNRIIAESVLSLIRQMKVCPNAAFDLFECEPAWGSDHLPALPFSFLIPDSVAGFQYLPWALASQRKFRKQSKHTCLKDNLRRFGSQKSSKG